MTDIYPKDFSATAGSNSTVGGINIAEGMQTAQVNDAMRAICAVFASPDFGTGSGFKVDAIGESTASAGVTITSLLAAGYFRLTGAISPTSITADQDDYAPTGHAAATTFRLTSDASRTITGLAGGAGGRVVVVENVGSNAIVLADSDASSTAANRFALTGDLTLSANDVVVLKYDATSSRWRALAFPYQAPTQASAPTVQTFTSSGTWTKPTGCRSIKIRMVGAGGGGAGASSTNRAAGGGGGGGYLEKILDVTSIASSTVTIGAAGAAGSAGGAGGNGGDTIWADGTNTLTAGGGSGGAAASASVGGSLAAGGTATGGHINIPGGKGAHQGGGVDFTVNGIGGDSQLGVGGRTQHNGTSGQVGGDGQGYGAGGGAGIDTGTNRAGGAGAAGVMIVEEFY